MIKIHSSTEKSFSSTDTSTLMSSSSSRWAFVHLKAGGDLFSIKYVNGSSLIPKEIGQVKQGDIQTGLILVHSFKVKFWNFIPKSLLETIEHGDGTGSLADRLPKLTAQLLSY